jgi:hypothetical protein
MVDRVPRQMDGYFEAEQHLQRHGGGEPLALRGRGVALELRAVEPGDDPSESRLA